MTTQRSDAQHRRVLVVSPHFPPVNAPDMQRVRMSLPYFSEFGWEPYVLAVAPTVGQIIDPLLVETIPRLIKVTRVRAVPASMSKPLGIGNIAVRAAPFLYRAGSRLIIRHRIDLTYFSTTMFLSMPLGRLWWRLFGVPYVLDMQDPWVSDYYQQHPETRTPPKYAAARRIHAVLEPWTMKQVSALIAVSDEYLITLRRRYPWITERMCTTLPFGASLRDFELLEAHPQPNRSFNRYDGATHGVYVGRGGDDMKPALRILFHGLRTGVELMPAAFGSLKLHFIGTDYATDARARKTVEPVAREMGVHTFVDEHTSRVSYFEALQLMRDADFLVLIGSDDPGYTASKVYPYLMAGKPILAILHERSSLLPVLREAGAETVVTFSEDRENTPVEELLAAWNKLIAKLKSSTVFNQDVIERYSAREMARRQCAVFDKAVRSDNP